MKLEVLISTMHQTDMSIFKRMNIRSDALAINQCDREYREDTIKSGENTLKMISIRDRGLSKSRNLAIENSNADICVLADDDLVYADNYPDIIKSSYFIYPDADIIAFRVPSLNRDRPTSVLESSSVGFLKSMRLCSFQLTFRRKSIVENNIRFNTLFGAGARYSCGEENIWLSDCLKSGLEIRFESEQIATVCHRDSTWFHGFDDALFNAKGAMFYAMKKELWLPLILQYAVRKRRLYKNNLSFFRALGAMFNGRSDYLSLLREEKGELSSDSKNATLFLVRKGP